MKTVIIGGVAGGATAAARLRRLDEKMEIVMLERGGHISFANCALPYYVGDTIQEKRALTLQTPESFNSRFNVDVRINSEVTAINRREKSVTVLDRTTGKFYSEPYDKLVYSPGAKPLVPAIAGIDPANTFTVRTIPDASGIKEFIAKNSPKTASVIGGGFIGLEMAENLAEAGLEVAIYEGLPYIATMLDRDIACEVMLYARQKGIKLECGTQVNDIAALGADMTVLAIGVVPETELAKEAGLELGIRGAVVVDKHMRTSDEHIYAVGDAVQVRNNVTGFASHLPLAGPANRQARIAADNICGGDSVYTGVQGSAVFKFFDMTVACTGLSERDMQKTDINYDKVFLRPASHATYYPGSSQMSIKVLFSKPDSRILGAQIAGKEGVDKRADVLATAIKAGMTARDLAELDLCYAPPFSSEVVSQKVC